MRPPAAIVLRGWREAGSGRAVPPLRIAGGRIATHPQGDSGPGGGAEGLIQGRGQDQRVDLGDAFLTPGLVDMHVHLSRGAPGGDLSEGASEEDVLAANLGAHLRGGVTAVRSLGDRTARPSPSLLPSGRPLVVWSARALAPTGGYGAFLGRSVSPEETAEEAVGRELARGARVLKLVLSGSVDFQAGTVAEGGLAEAYARRLVAAARSAGMQVAAHANGPPAVRRALDLGVDTLEHGLLIGEAEVEAIAAAGVAWVPTLTPLAALLGPAAPRSLPAVWEAHLTRVAQARGHEARILAGTDAGAPGVPHGSLTRELALLALAGFSPSELRRMATETAAGLLSLGRGYGTLAPGAVSDLVWFEADPFVHPPPAAGLVAAAEAICRSSPLRARGAVLSDRLVWWSDQ